jgi:hypothetical protein
MKILKTLRDEYIRIYVELANKAATWGAKNLIDDSEIRKYTLLYLQSGRWSALLEKHLNKSYIFTAFLPWRWIANMQQLGKMTAEIKTDTENWVRNEYVSDHLLTFPPMQFTVNVSKYRN